MKIQLKASEHTRKALKDQFTTDKIKLMLNCVISSTLIKDTDNFLRLIMFDDELKFSIGTERWREVRIGVLHFNNNTLVVYNNGTKANTYIIK